ncbi:MAG: mechanosensitive ion channel, partial [Gammaproteobacteria bacterium]
KKAQESAPQQIAALRKEVAALETRAPPKLPDSLARKDLSDLAQQLRSGKADLTALTNSLDQLEPLLKTQSQRSQQVRERINEARNRQPEIAEELNAAVAENRPQRLIAARRWALEHESLALAAEIEMLNQELLAIPARLEVLTLQRDKATLELNWQLQFVALLQALVDERRLSEAEFAREEAVETERRAFGKHPLVQEIAQQNTLLGEQLNELAAALEQISNEEINATSQARQVADNFSLARQKLEIAGLSEALGQVLLEQRGALPEAADFRAAEKRRQQLVVESSLRQIRNQQERARLRDINAYVDTIMAPLSETWKSLLRLEILGLVEARRDLIDKAIAADDTYLRELAELDFAQRQLLENVRAFNRFLDERLLWVRTGDPPSLENLQTIADRVQVFLSPQHWAELARALFLPDEFPWVLLLGLALAVLLMLKSKALRAALENSGNNVGQMRHDRYRFTMKALLLTLVLALPWPILFAALGLHLQYVRSFDALDLETHIYQSPVWTGQFVPAIGAAFDQLALYVFYFIAFRIFCERKGLAVVHLGWNPENTEKLRKEIRRLMAVFLPTVFILIAAITYDPAALAGGLSRLFFIIVMAALAWFFVSILAPRTGVLKDYYLHNPGNPLTWFRFLWVGLALLLPMMLAVLATMGYVYTAVQFGSRLVDTLWLIVAIILIHQLVVRWVLLTERRLVFKDALERHRAQRAAREAQEEGDVGELPVEEPEIDYSALSEDTKKLINNALTLVGALGLWVTWSAVMPAFRILEEVSLWSYTATIDGADKLVPVTLADFLLGILVIMIIVLAALRLPALLEIALLTRLKITAGSRYAISTLTQYTIVGIGIVVAFNIVGGSWDAIQWLIAALGVGIGFGLQEIVANFICGIILLFERPIRIGDVVTVGETSGVVTRIRIRSTTIRNWDQKELVVPNKEFITGRLLNWTLSDPMARIVIPVGIAYGSDVALALKLIREAADEHERVLDDPQPLVTFEGFGDNALTIMMRCYIETMEIRLQTQSELNEAINHKFEQAGIVIAFPQRDIHLDTSQPLDLRIHQVQPES